MAFCAYSKTMFCVTEATDVVCQPSKLWKLQAGVSVESLYGKPFCP